VEESAAETPEALRRVRDFINSEDLEERTDALATPEALTSWLVSRQLLADGDPADERDLDTVRRVRAALRQLTFANNGGPPAPTAWDVLNQAAADARLRVDFAPDRSRLIPASAGVTGALGRLLVDVYAAMSAGTWPRLKACRDDSCRWAFYDRSKNRSGAWCSMAACGNKAKTRAYRRRSKSAPIGAP
jgi:predicted RNA-binding Zn ribbon-like protein